MLQIIETFEGLNSRKDMVEFLSEKRMHNMSEMSALSELIRSELSKEGNDEPQEYTYLLKKGLDNLDNILEIGLKLKQELNNSVG